MRLRATELSAEERRLQADVREFLDHRLPACSYRPSLGMAAPADPSFSRDLAAQGWVGMTLPAEYGGHGRTAVERQIVTEELLRRGAPVGYHWIADRQSGPQILAAGTEQQKRELLPGIAAGELSFGIGMSEPDSGSDLASLHTWARPTTGGWMVSGTKVWTSGAAYATHLLALFRTSDERHAGLTQFIVDCRTEGIRISTIPFIDGTRHFCEVVFENVFLPDGARLGPVGGGWGQSKRELSLERGGVDRWMSPFPLVESWVRDEVVDGEIATADLGELLARAWAFRGLSLAVARTVDQGETPAIEAALVKEMATRFEQETVERVARTAPALLTNPPGTQFEDLLGEATLVNPAWTIRGGTVEILRTIIAKELTRP